MTISLCRSTLHIFQCIHSTPRRPRDRAERPIGLQNHRINVCSPRKAAAPHGGKDFLARHPFLPHGRFEKRAAIAKKRRLRLDQALEPHRLEGHAIPEPQSSAKALSASSSETSILRIADANVEPKATVMTRSKAFILDRVRFPVVRRKSTSHRPDNPEASDLIPGIEEHRLAPLAISQCRSPTGNLHPRTASRICNVPAFSRVAWTDPPGTGGTPTDTPATAPLARSPRRGADD